jgi:flagellar motor switch protein FliM
MNLAEASMRSDPGKRGSVRPVDITGNERRLGARTVSMQKVAESFTRGARRSLPFLVKRRCRLVAGQVGGASIALAEPSAGPFCQITLESSGKPGWAVVRIDTGAIQLIVDGSLGGVAPEDGEEEEPIPMTQISLAQRALVTRVARALGNDLAEAIKEETGVPIQVTRAECLRGGEEPSLPKDAVAAECVFDGLPSRAAIWLFASGEVLEAALRGRTAATSAAGDPRMVQAMSEVPVDVVAELGRVSIGLRRVLSLRPGEVLRLATATDDPIQVRVGGLPKLYGVPVLSRGQVSVQVTGRHDK